MNTTIFIVELVGAIVLGFFIGFVYTKIFVKSKFDKEIKNIKETIYIKDNEYVLLKKRYRSEHRKVIVLSNKVEELEKRLDKKIKQFNLLKDSIIKLKNKVRQKNKALKELENLLIAIQKDYEILDRELEIEKSKNSDLKYEIEQLQKSYKRQIEVLTQKANDLYTIKNSDELKNAKEVFDKLRNKAIN